ncbi:hypothetical protein [Metabacillus endolithicus]|uniref:DUF4401 domain-containing protein n=1 Tax=Metabacillus endolithicus TaxID=1535204 RepID=A0ABW5BYK9_9BACI
MNREKKDIIVNEIKYWKESKLLPDTYCNFLLALYTEGSHDEKGQPVEKTKRPNVAFIGIGILSFLLLCTLLVTYFTELSFVLQTVTAGIFVLASGLVTAYVIRKKAAFQIPLVITFVQLFVSSITIVDFAVKGTELWVVLTVVCNCMLWVVIGKLFRIYYLLVSGIIALFIVILSIIF